MREFLRLGLTARPPRRAADRRAVFEPLEGRRLMSGATDETGEEAVPPAAEPESAIVVAQKAYDEAFAAWSAHKIAEIESAAKATAGGFVATAISDKPHPTEVVLYLATQALDAAKAAAAPSSPFIMKQTAPRPTARPRCCPCRPPAAPTKTATPIPATAPPTPGGTSRPCRTSTMAKGAVCLGHL